MAIKTYLNCPLGSECEVVINNEIHRCRWYTNVQGVNPSTGEQINEHDCAMVFLPLLMINVAKEAREGAAATENLRNLVANPLPRIPNTEKF